MSSPLISFRNFCFYVLYILLAGTAFQTLQAQSTPKVGLALSGGGAKGLAHIGILQVLEEHGIYPDVVSGTSMGSIVGGLYAIGYSPDRLARFATELNWNNYFTDIYPRAFLPVEERYRADRYLLSFPINEEGIEFPRGLIRGRKIQALLAGLTSSVHETPAFDDFPLPFRAVATDLATGEAVIFREGKLRMAIRASMSIPSAFEPLEYQDRLLVDGFLVRNLPVEDAIALGADIVIAVDVGSPLMDQEELKTIVDVLEQTSSFGSIEPNQHQRDLADVVIDPEIEPYGAISYDRADSLIFRGRLAAIRALPRIRRVMDSAGITLPMPAPDRQGLLHDTFYVTDVVFEGDNPTTRRLLSQLFRFRPPGELTPEEMSDLLGVLYGSGFFELVDYDIIALTDSTHQLRLSGQAGADRFVRGSFNYDTDYKAQVLFNYTDRNIFLRGSVLSAELGISEYPRAALDYLIYTRTTPSLGLHFQNVVNFFPGRIYAGNRLINEFDAHYYRSSLSSVSGIGRQWYAELGILSERLSQNRRFFTLEDGEAVMNQRAGFFSISRDSYDRTHFPNSGSLASARLQYAFAGNIRERSLENRRIDIRENLLFTARGSKVFPFSDRFVLEGTIAGGLANNPERSLVNLLYLGRALPGQIRFFDVYGLRFMELPVTSFGQVTAKLRVEVGQDNFIAFGGNYLRYEQQAYSLILDDSRQEIERTDGSHSALAIELGSLTPFGPILLSTEYNLPLRRVNVALHAGYYF